MISSTSTITSLDEPPRIDTEEEDEELIAALSESSNYNQRTSMSRSSIRSEASLDQLDDE